MNDTQAWSILKIAPTTSKREIRKAYAAQAQLCHPEEQPEEFARLQEAYQIALKYQEIEVLDRSEVSLDLESVHHQYDSEMNEVVEEIPHNVLLEAWQTGWEEEQTRRQNTGVLKELIEIFEDPQIAQGNKAWEAFFVSDSFLKEYFEEDFAESLDFYLEHQAVYGVDELPQGFLVQLSIAYAMIPETNGCMYQSGEIPMRKVIAKYWNQQTEIWRLQRGSRILMRAENKAKIQAFSDYIFLRIIEKQGLLLEQREDLWYSIIWHGEPTYLYEVSKGTYGQSTSTTILKLFGYWLFNEDMPLFMIQRMYQRYQLKTIETSHYYSVYKELKEVILQKYPDIEKDCVQEEIIRWMYRLLEIESAFMEKAAVSFALETEEETEEIHKLFAREEWKKYWNHSYMMQRLLWKTYFNNIPMTIAQYFYQAYNSPEGMHNQNRKELVEKSMGAIVNYRKAVEQTSLDFWEYVFMRGFGICTSKVSPEEIGDAHLNDDRKKYTRDEQMYLPAYIKTKYRTSYEWQKEFVGYNAETGQIENPKFYEFKLPDGDIIKAEYHLHFIAYYQNGNRRYSPYLSYESFEKYQSTFSAPEEFFFLLALTKIEEKDRQPAKVLVLEWLSKTALVETTFSPIADCITQNNAEDRDTQECALLENESMCLLIKRTVQGLQLYEYTELGLKARDFRGGRDWQQYDMETILQSHIKPIPTKIATFETEGLSGEEKTKIILEGLKLYAKHEKGGARSEPVLPKEYPELIPLFEGDMGWLTDSFVVLHRKLSQNKFHREVLYISVGKWGCYSSYLKDGEMEKAQRNMVDLQDKIKRTKYETCILEGRIVRDTSGNRILSWIDPILFGKNGKMYGYYGFARLCETESVFEMLSKKFDLENVVRCEVYEGKMTVSNRTGELEYCFTQEEYQEAKESYDKDWNKAYSLIEEEIAEKTETEQYSKETLERMAAIYLNEMDKAERYKDRCETLAEYYCIL